MRSGQNGSTRRCTYAVRDVAVIEEHAFFCYTVEVWGMIDTRTICRDGLRRVVVRHDEDDVWPVLSRHCC